MTIRVNGYIVPFVLGADYTDFTDLVHDFVYTKTVLIRVIRA